MGEIAIKGEKRAVASSDVELDFIEFETTALESNDTADIVSQRVSARRQSKQEEVFMNGPVTDEDYTQAFKSFKDYVQQYRDGKALNMQLGQEPEFDQILERAWVEETLRGGVRIGRQMVKMILKHGVGAALLRREDRSVYRRATAKTRKATKANAWSKLKNSETTEFVPVDPRKPRKIKKRSEDSSDIKLDSESEAKLGRILEVVDKRKEEIAARKPKMSRRLKIEGDQNVCNGEE